MEMQRNRGLLILAGVTAITVTAAAWSVSERYRTVALEQKEGGLVFPDLQENVASISFVELTRAKGSFSLNRNRKGGRTWVQADIRHVRREIEKMIGGLVTLSYFEPKTIRAKLYPKIEVEDVCGGRKIHEGYRQRRKRRRSGRRHRWEDKNWRCRAGPRWCLHSPSK